jgi:sodium-dependent dicarboxylate transporter 2/3/5
MDFIKYGIPVTILGWLVLWFWTIFGYWQWLPWPNGG